MNRPLSDTLARRHTRGRVSPLARREDWTGRALVSPTVLLIVLVVLLPFVTSVVYAFQEFQLIDIGPLGDGKTEWTLDNFRIVLTSSGFQSALWTTIVYSIGCTLGTVISGMVMSLALRRRFPGRGLIRGLVLIPYILPLVAAVTIWKQLLNSQYGFVNAIGERFLGWDEPISFLTTTSMDVWGLPIPVALTVVILFDVWKSGPLAYLFFTARLQATQGDIEEAALIDGATPLQSFRHVLLPQMYGVIAIMIILRFIWSFQSFNDIYLLSGGAGGTEVLAVSVYNELTTRGNVGGASALGLVMMVILTALTLLYLQRTRKEVAE